MLPRLRPTSLALALVPALAAAATSAPAPQPRSPVQQVAWLAGCWELAGPRGVTEEHWLRPAGGQMIGVSRTIRRTAAGDSTTAHEFLRLFARGDTLVYAALPSGQTLTEFKTRTPSESLVTFENPAHDFPQRIIYRRRGADSLLARIEGPRGGTVRGIDYPYRRVKCE